MFYGVEDMTLEFFIGVPLIVIAAIIVYKNHHKNTFQITIYKAL